MTKKINRNEILRIEAAQDTKIECMFALEGFGGISPKDIKGDENPTTKDTYAQIYKIFYGKCYDTDGHTKLKLGLSENFGDPVVCRWDLFSSGKDKYIGSLGVEFDKKDYSSVKWIIEMNQNFVKPSEIEEILKANRDIKIESHEGLIKKDK